MVESSVERGWQRLTAGDESPPPSPAIAVVLLVARVVLDNLFDNLLDIADLDKDVLGLQVGMDDATLPVEVI